MSQSVHKTIITGQRIKAKTAKTDQSCFVFDIYIIAHYISDNSFFSIS